MLKLKVGISFEFSLVFIWSNLTIRILEISCNKNILWLNFLRNFKFASELISKSFITAFQKVSVLHFLDETINLAPAQNFCIFVSYYIMSSVLKSFWGYKSNLLERVILPSITFFSVYLEAYKLYFMYFAT